MALEPGADPLDDPRYVRLLRVEKEGRALKIGGTIVVIATGAYLLLAGKRRVKPPTPNPDAASESN